MSPILKCTKNNPAKTFSRLLELFFLDKITPPKP